MRLLAGLLVVVLGAAACGGESDREQLVSALAEGLLEDESLAEHGITEDEARCTAEQQVDGVGTERMQALGFTDEEFDVADLDDEEIAVLAGAMEDCITNIDGVLVDALVAKIVDEPDPAFPVNRTEARCVAEAVANDLGLGRLVIVGVEGERHGDGRFDALEPAEVDVLADAYFACTDVRSRVLDEIASDATSDEVLACVDDNISDDDLRAILAAGFSSGDRTEAQRVLSPAVEACT